MDIDYSSRLNVIIRDKLLFLKLGDIDLKWKIDEQKGTVVEYESTYVSKLTGLKYEFEVKNRHHDRRGYQNRLRSE